jgi:hypothetical protein
MARYFFNGSYSVRAGYHGHGARKSSLSTGLLTCPVGHVYSGTETVDERATGGCCYKRAVKECPLCKKGNEAQSPVVSQSNSGALDRLFEEMAEDDS